MTSLCRVDRGDLHELFKLGDMYVSDFITPDYDYVGRNKHPLTLSIGKTSNVVQLNYTTNPDEMYKQYWYRSGTNATMKAEMANIAGCGRLAV